MLVNKLHLNFFVNFRCHEYQDFLKVNIKFLFAVKMQGKQVMSELDFAAEILPKGIKILAVTGTNGKSTVVTFAGQVLDFSLVFSMLVCNFCIDCLFL